MSTSAKTRLVLAVLVAAAVGCGDGVVADGGDVVYLTPFNVDEAGPSQTEGPSVVFAPGHQDEFEADREQYDVLIDEFSQRSDEVLTRPDVEEVLGAFERSFIYSGRYLELAELYRQHYESYGIESVAGPAWAWSLVKLGNEPAAEEMIDRLEEARSGDPETWVVVAKYHARRAHDSTESARKAKEAFERVLELNPQFQSYKTMERGRIDQELQAIGQILDRAEAMDEDDPVAAADAPMHHEDGEPVDDEPTDQPQPDDTDQPDEVAGDQAEQIAGQVDADAEDIADDATMAPDEFVKDLFPEDLPPEEVARLAEEQAERQDAAEEQQQQPDEQPDAEPQDDEPSVQHLLARARQAFQRGGDENFRRAESYYEQVLAIDPENMDAGIGMLRVAERTGAPDDMMRDQVDTLSQHEMTARQAYELGLFSLHRLNDRDRATSLLEQVEELDPSFARRMGVDELLESN